MGQDKALIMRPDGTRQIDWLVKLARLAEGEVFLSMREPGVPPALLPAIFDLHPGAGPLAGLSAFHGWRPGEAVMVLSCDLFLLDEETVGCLLAKRDPSRLATCFANRIDGHPEPLCTIYEASALPQAEGWLERGKFGARRFLRSLDPLVLELPHPAALDNANTPLELAECFSKLSHGVREKPVEIFWDESWKSVTTLANTVGGLFEEISFRYRLRTVGQVYPWRNREICGWDTGIADLDQIAFPGLTGGRIPPLLPPP